MPSLPSGEASLHLIVLLLFVCASAVAVAVAVSFVTEEFWSAPNAAHWHGPRRNWRNIVMVANLSLAIHSLNCSLGTISKSHLGHRTYLEMKNAP
jgi:hypothetical protein